MSNLATLAIYVLRTTNYVIADLVYSRGDYFVVAAIAISAQGPLEYYRLAQPWRRTLTCPNRYGWSFNVTAPYPPLTSLDLRDLDPDSVSACPRSVPRRLLDSLSLLLFAYKVSLVVSVIGGCCAYYTLYTNATRPRCCTCSERCRLSVITLFLHLRLGLLGISTASVPDAKADSLGWKAHNLHWKLYRRHW